MAEMEPGRRAVAVPLLARAAVALYPRWWRERYGEDLLSFVTDLRFDDRSVLRALPDLVAGALRARLSGSGAPAMPSLWWARARASVTLATLPAMLLLPLVVLAMERGAYTNGAGQLSAGQRLAETAGGVLFPILLVTGIVLLFGWRLLVAQTPEVPGGAGRFGFEAAMAAPVLVLGGALALSWLSNRLSPDGLKSASWARAPGTHRWVVHLTWASGHPLLGPALHEAAFVWAVAGWTLAAVLVARACRRAPLATGAIRAGVLVARLTAACTVALAAAFTVYALAIILQPWHLIASGGCASVPPIAALRAYSGCSALTAPAGHTVLTSPVSGAAGVWIALAVLGAVLSVLGARLAGESMRTAVALDA
ncbi:MAG TPA: hypothetical protein VEH29_05090 [Acidimicrobiales bacterium]|nr:hypothetical protein [Acidimicrobiales bacterium]